MGSIESKDDEIGQLGYEIIDTINLPNKSQPNCEIHKGCHVPSDTSVLLFIYNISSSSKDLQGINLEIQYLKTLRHPCILRYFDNYETGEIIALITERALPICCKVMEEMSAVEICDGLHSLLNALIFLHEKCQLTHNNICLDSVYVSSTRQWKLGGMQHVKRVSQKSRSSQLVKDLLQFTDLAVQVSEYLERDLADLVTSFLSRCRELASASDAAEIAETPLHDLLQHDLFKIDLINIINFLNHIPLKSEEEKDHFFRTLTPKLYSIPEEVVATRLIPLLITRMIFLEPAANSHFISNLLTPSYNITRGSIESECRGGVIYPILGSDLYERYISPRISHIFTTVCDINIRLILLRHIHLYAASIPLHVLQDHILKQVWYGVVSGIDEMCSASFLSLSHLVTLLGSDIVTSGHVKECDNTKDNPKPVHFTSNLPKLKSSLPLTSSSTSISSLADNKNTFDHFHKSRDIWSGGGSSNMSVSVAAVQPIRAVSPYTTTSSKVGEGEDVGGKVVDTVEVMGETWEEWDKKGEEQLVGDTSPVKASSSDSGPDVEPLPEQHTVRLTTSPTSKVMNTPPGNSGELGAGLDIKSVVVKKKEVGEEPDFFADLGLQPNLTFNTSPIIPAVKVEYAGEGGENERNTDQFLVEVVAGESTVESGWDEADWDDF